MWLVLLLLTGIAVLAMIQRRHVARVRADRGRLFEECERLLEEPELVPRGLDFALLQGRWRGREVRIEPVVDTLSMRTLPVLWLVVTVRGHHDVPGRLSVLARACGTEFYARHGETGKPVTMTPGWPPALAVRASHSDVATERPELLGAVRDLMANGTVKHVAVAPDHVRVVWKCATGESGAYRVTRRVDLTGARADAESLRRVLDAVGAIIELSGHSRAVHRPVTGRAVI
jgi:hypothetical protein